MGSRLPKLLFACFWLLWTAIYIPFHTRGAIPLVSGSALAAPLSSCCAPAQPARAADPAQKLPAPLLSANCAVCDLASRMSVSTAFLLVVPKAGVLQWVSVDRAAARVYATQPQLPLQSRAPPRSPLMA